MKRFILWLSGLMKDENGVPSSKRFIGIVSGLSLCVTLFLNQITGVFSTPSPEIITAVAALAFGSLGLSSVDKIWKRERSED